MPQYLSTDPNAGEPLYMVPFKDGMRPATKTEYDEYQRKQGSPRYQMLDTGMAAAGAMALTGGAAAGMSTGGVLPFVARTATSPLVVGGGRAVAGMATGESLPQALLEGGQAAAYAKLGKVAAGGRAAAPVASAAAPAAKAVADNAGSLMQFGKEAAARNPKLGEKIWILLDGAGKPLRVLTPDQAGAAARAGEPTTWIKNLWQAR